MEACAAGLAVRFETADALALPIDPRWDLVTAFDTVVGFSVEVTTIPHDRVNLVYVCRPGQHGLAVSAIAHV